MKPTLWVFNTKMPTLLSGSSLDPNAQSNPGLSDNNSSRSDLWFDDNDDFFDSDKW